MPIFSRRSLLGASVVVVAGGAGVAAELLRHPHRSPNSTGTTGLSATLTPVVPTAPALQDALARERALLARLAQAASVAPGLAARVAVLRADHLAHTDALAGLIVAAGATPAPASTTPSSSASSLSASSSSSLPSSPSPSAPVLPPTVAELVRWEKAAAASFFADFDAATGAAAAVLASIYACEQTHVAWLT